MDLKIPKSWEDISLSTYQQYQKIDENQDQLDLIINKLSVLIGVSKIDLEELTVTELIKAMESFSWMKTLPQPKNHDKIKIGKNKYILTNLKTISTAQMLDVEAFYNGGLDDNLHRILASIYLSTKTNLFITKAIPYNANDFDARAEDFKNIDMQRLFEISLFFLSIVQIYTNDLQITLMKGMENQLKMKDQ